MKDLYGYSKIAKSIERIKALQPKDGYYLAFSGGKDSMVIKRLADMAKAKYTSHYSVTSIDPPELIRFIKKYYPEVKWEFQKEPFLKLLVKKGFPQRQRRWCCAIYKEVGGEGKTVMTGIRWAESHSRSKRRVSEPYYKSPRDECRNIITKKMVNPIIDWSDEDVWDFIRSEKLPYCELYDQGWHRLGCVFCPMAGKARRREYKRYPGFVKAFKIAFQKMYDDKKKKGLKSVDRWKDGSEMFEWWLHEKKEYKSVNQTKFDFGD